MLGGGHGLWSPRSRSRLATPRAWNPRDAAFGWLTGWRFPCCVSGLLSNVGQRGLTWGKALLQLGELRVCVLPTWPGAEGVPWLLLGPAPAVLAPAALADCTPPEAGWVGGEDVCLPSQVSLLALVSFLLKQSYASRTVN